MQKISFLIPSTSKNRKWNVPTDSYLYNTINSFNKTCANSKNIKYKFFIGIDSDDIFYNEKNIEIFKQLADIIFIPVSVEKGHVTKIWNCLAKHAFNESFDYMYICGDDVIQYTNDWVEESIKVLQKNNNIGVTGPMCINNKKILTQCFVHNTHYKIFGFFFPEEIKNWYCDDWINLIYPSTPIPTNYTCNNIGGEPRYKIIMCPNLSEYVKRDKLIIEKYINGNDRS